MDSIHLMPIDYVILAVYFLFVLGIGWALRGRTKTSEDFFLSGRGIPAWVAGLAFLSANLGAQEVIGMAASGAKYGIATSHFYWVGAIPAMVFVGVFMMPFYYGSRARSVPEYLKLRYDEKTRAFNAISFAVMTVFSSGISMYALAKLLGTLLGWDFNFSIWVSGLIVLLYIYLGGLTSAIYNEVLQFFLIVLGFIPLVYLGLRDAGGWSGLQARLSTVATANHFAPGAWSESWQHMTSPAANPMGVEWFGMVMGLGFVLSFGYWCTDFLVIQRAMAAHSMAAARRTPLIAAVPKMFFPFLVIVPGMIAVALTAMPDKNYRIPPPIVADAAYAKAVDAVKSASPADSVAAVKAVGDALGKKVAPDKIASLVAANAASKLSDAQIKQGLYNSIAENYYDGVILSLVKKYCPPGLLGLALTALLASFMSGMAGNVTAFNTVFTYDLYQAYFAKGKSDHHYFIVGKVITVVGIILSIGAAYFASMYDNAMDIIQLVFGFVNAPLFATFLLGMFWKRTTGTGAFLGLFGGIAGSALFHSLTIAHGNLPGVKGGYLHVAQEFPSEMAQNFWLAAFAFIICFTLTLVISLATRSQKSDADLKGLVYSLTPKIVDNNIPIYQRPAVVGVVLLIACVILNIIFW